MKQTPRKNKVGALKMADLAAMAGVSKSTVSRALQNSELINKETREKIQALAKQHNYRLNTQARNFRLKERLTINVIIPSVVEAKWQISDPFFLELLGSISVSLMEKGHEMLLSGVNLNSTGVAEDQIERINCDGVIVIGQADVHRQINAFAENFAALVVWGAGMEGQKYCTVGGDNVRGGLLATQHLLDIGCSRVAIIGDRSMPEGQLRHRGYLQALENAGLQCDPVLEVSTGSQKDEGYEAAHRLLASGTKFDAIFALSDALAMAAINALDEHGVEVPADVAVVGYDDISLSRYYTPSLTTVHQDREIGGRLLVEKLLQILDGKQPQSYCLPTNLVIRKSTRK